MKARRLIVLLVLISSWSATGIAQPSLDGLLGTSDAPAELSVIAQERVQLLVSSMKNFSTDQKTLHRVFRKINRTFLRKYEAYSDFDEVFTEGKYDCLTATALFSTVLDEMNFKFDVVETNYHIFIIVHASDGEVLLETTDRLGGFVTDADVIARRTADYRNNILASSLGDRQMYNYSFSLYQKVPVERLSGLLYYNQAVKAYNGGNWLACAQLIEKAYAQYASVRCEELGDILIRTVMERQVSDQLRMDCLAHLKQVVIARGGTIASN